ncbi:3-deoxy-D-manno-octulosonate cytidylyltransferase [Rhodopirellula maiorica SM1]|uniref:3-deoxy-D-manno-octulosonate cytidylyltransferase n=2 Tax=Novipirellula TaxID=2795426 RepID=M5S5T6_9BACT|nr:3-deoxy-D-manno-octulosonate cytidylyltransferase [Rhodopirellula maiorica SM1]
MIVIPARLASTRLSEKLLRVAGGKTILRHTWEAASNARIADAVVVAVDDPKLADEVESFGGRFVMTSVDCPSGTDRIAEVAAQFPDFDAFINVQGDEPEIDPDTVDLVGTILINDASADIATIGTPIRSEALLQDPSCVKIVVAAAGGEAAGQSRAGQAATTPTHSQFAGSAIYFSREAVPHCRSGITPETLAMEPPLFWHHLGLYAYRRDFLEWFSNQPPSPLEQSERLEQLRAIEAGKRIVVGRVQSAAPGIDTEADFQAFAERIR